MRINDIMDRHKKAEVLKYFYEKLTLNNVNKGRFSEGMMNICLNDEEIKYFNIKRGLYDK